MENPKYLNEKEVHEITGISLSHLRNQRSCGVGLQYYKIGKSIRYSLQEVLNYMKKHKVQVVS